MQGTSGFANIGKIAFDQGNSPTGNLNLFQSQIEQGEYNLFR